MYSDIPLWLSIAFMVGGLAALAWSSDVFIDGAAAVARALGISPFIVGMVVIGFGTSAPELCVSAMSGALGHSNLSLGNAYGSTLFNIAVILGIAALIRPIVCRPVVSFVAGPVLAALALLSLWLLKDGACTRIDASILLAVFLVVLPLYCRVESASRPAGGESAECVEGPKTGMASAVMKLVVGLAVLVGSSHVLVWGAVDFAKFIGVSDLVIGLTIVAVGTSLPELASAVASARRGENEFVLGNIVGSNIFNTLAVVGIATFISPLAPDASSGASAFSPYVVSRDLPLMVVMSLSLLAFGVNWRRPREAGLIGRVKAVVWLVSFACYAALMAVQEISAS